MTKNKETVQIRMRVLHNLVTVVEQFPQYTLAQHITHFMRTKGDTQEKYFWDDSSLLKKIEDYYDELCVDLEPEKTEE